MNLKGHDMLLLQFRSVEALELVKPMRIFQAARFTRHDFCQSVYFHE
jgi:hypothetical protein